MSRTLLSSWFKAQPSARALENHRLSVKVKEIFISSRATYGTRRIKRSLLNLGSETSRRRVSKLMKQENLGCKTRRKFKVTTDSNHRLPITSNLLERNYVALRPNEKYVGDITYIWTQEGWLYLATVIDLFSRRVVGCSMKDHMRASLVNEALLMALWERKPGRGLIWHTDRGSQYAAESHRKILKDHSICQSMSRRGDCWDNSVAESFFHTLKTELTHHINYKTKEEAKKSIFEYIVAFYNRK